MRHLSAAALIACGLHLGAAEGPMVQVEAGDIQRSIERFWQTPWGRLWNDPALATLRAQAQQNWSETRQEAQMEAGIDPQAVINALQSLGFVVRSIDLSQKKADFQIQIDCGDQAEALMQLAADMPVAEVAGADAAFTVPLGDMGDAILARFGSVLILGAGEALSPMSVSSGEEDVTASIDLGAYMQAIQSFAEQMGQSFPEMPEQPPLHLDLRIIEQGFWERWDSEGAMATANQAVDLKLLGSLPSTTLLCLAGGLDGSKLWDLTGPEFIDDLAATQGQDGAQLRQMIDGQFQALGLDITLEGLITNLSGTIGIAVTPGSPFPAATIMLPASAEIDQLMAFALQMQLGQQPPESGAVMQLQIPTPLPVQIHLGRQEGHWVLSSDGPTITAMINGTPGGWVESPATQAALAVMDGAPDQIGTSDTAGLLRLLLGYVPMLAMSGVMPPDAQDMLQQQGTTAMQQLASMVEPGWLVAGPLGANYHVESKGLLTPVTLYGAIIPAIAIPNLMEARGQAGEAAVKANLKAGLFPAQVQFQAGGYLDRDQDGTGAYGFPAYMAGKPLPDSGTTLQLLGPEWNSAQPITRDGWQIKVWLPNGPSSATDQLAQLSPSAEDLQEQHWVAYAWPGPSVDSDLMYAIDITGTLYSSDYWGLEPQWNELYGGGNWGDAPTWDSQ
ncbi:MAG: hypothetical protein ACOCXA_03495 [Planctomycetota bacterium]